jgi:hypothetical protein
LRVANVFEAPRASWIQALTYVAFPLSGSSTANCMHDLHAVTRT